MELTPGNSIDVLAQGATSFASGVSFEYEVNSEAAFDAAHISNCL